MFETSGQNALILHFVDAVADAKDTSPLDLPLLYDTMDPDALERLVASGDEDLRVAFGVAGVRVTISGTGDITSVMQMDPMSVTVDTDEDSSGIASD